MPWSPSFGPWEELSRLDLGRGDPRIERSRLKLPGNKLIARSTGGLRPNRGFGVHLPLGNLPAPSVDRVHNRLDFTKISAATCRFWRIAWDVGAKFTLRRALAANRGS